MRIDADLKALRSSKSDGVRRFLNNPDFIAKITQRKAMFHRPPVGPVGMYLSISDESQLGISFTSYFGKQGGVERIAVASSAEECKRLAYGGDRRISKVYSRDGSQYFKKGASEVPASPHASLRHAFDIYALRMSG
eukprot:scaffold234299_cov36-Prasinocladus_malaysianus.AAC.2